HHQATAVAVDGAAGERRGQRGQKKAQRIRAEQRRGREPKLIADARAEYRNRIVKSAPGNDLRKPERRNETEEHGPGHNAMLTWRRAHNRPRAAHRCYFSGGPPGSARPSMRR